MKLQNARHLWLPCGFLTNDQTANWRCRVNLAEVENWILIQQESYQPDRMEARMVF